MQTPIGMLLGGKVGSMDHTVNDIVFQEEFEWLQNGHLFQRHRGARVRYLGPEVISIAVSIQIKLIIVCYYIS